MRSLVNWLARSRACFDRSLASRVRVSCRWVLCCLSVWTVTSLASALPDSYGNGTGRDGALTVAASDVVINRYVLLSNAVSPGATNITLSNATGFTAGVLVMVYQTKAGTFAAGDTMNVAVSNTAAGHYELARIVSVNGRTLTLDHALTLAFSNTAQVISVPEYTTVSVPGAPFVRSLSAKSWDGST
jgi:large repetitive protein